MNSDERLAAYVAARTPEGRLAVLSAGNKLLTPRQKRRLKRKEGSRKTHSHAGLPVAEVSGGVFRRVPCERCCPLRKARLLGG